MTNAEIVRLFKDYGWDTSDFEILTYNDPWYTKLVRMVWE